jgi:hypothetical protein
MNLAKPGNLRDNETMIRRVIPVFLFLAFLTAACSVQAYAPKPSVVYDSQNLKSFLQHDRGDRTFFRNGVQNEMQSNRIIGNSYMFLSAYFHKYKHICF